MKVRSITIIFKDLIQNIKGENVCVCTSTILWMRSRRWNMYVFNVETLKIQTKTTKSLLHLWLQQKELKFFKPFISFFRFFWTVDGKHFKLLWPRGYFRYPWISKTFFFPLILTLIRICSIKLLWKYIHTLPELYNDLFQSYKDCFYSMLK